MTIPDSFWSGKRFGVSQESVLDEKKKTPFVGSHGLWTKLFVVAGHHVSITQHINENQPETIPAYRQYKRDFTYSIHFALRTLNVKSVVLRCFQPSLRLTMKPNCPWTPFWWKETGFMLHFWLLQFPQLPCTIVSVRDGGVFGWTAPDWNFQLKTQAEYKMIYLIACEHAINN